MDPICTDFIIYIIDYKNCDASAWAKSRENCEQELKNTGWAFKIWNLIWL